MSRADLTALYPQMPGEDAVKWTGRLLSHAREHRTNRQCSIGYHGECSNPSGDTCNCLCHDAPASAEYTVEGHVEGGVWTITRVEEGRHHWPPVDGEPATMWAHWIFAYSEQDAKARAVNKEAARLGLKPVKPEHIATVPDMEPVKPEPWQVFAEKSGALTGEAAKNKGDAKAGVISQEEYGRRREWAEAELIEAWREYVHSLK